MAGMFYSLQEAADKLGKSEDDVRKLAQTGKLRVFKDGSHELFKVDEVNALLAGGGDVEAEAEPLPLEAAPDEELAELLDTDAPASGEEPFDTNDMLGLAEEDAPAAPAGGEEEDLSALEPLGVEEDEVAPLEPAETGGEDLTGLEPLAVEEDEVVPLEPAETGEEDLTGLEPLAFEQDEMAPLEPAETGEEDLAGLEPVAEEELPVLESTDEADASSELGLAPEAQEEKTSDEDELLFLEEDEQPSAEPAGGAGADTDEEIMLAAETGGSSLGSDITDMDTALTGEGVNVLGETDTGYDVTEDSMAETVGPAGSTGTASGIGGTDAEASLEEIEDDVNLDSFGSGSGLLDLSLQADDTSLGGILDEIYTAEGGEEGPTGGEAATVDDMTAEAEHVAPEEELGMPEAVAIGPVVVPTFAAYAEAAPDTQSNILGMLLFLPLLALLYMAIVAVAAQRGVMPSILAPIQSLVWYIVGGGIVLAVIVFGVSFAAGAEKGPKVAKPKKEKAAKKAKAPKAKREKPAKAEKPAKEKKGLFGKKK
jgi:excisionase family DNA binding protein